MKVIIKLIIIFMLLFVFTNAVSAQYSVRFNDYGTYLVQNGKTTEIYTEHEILLAFLWDNYVILEGYSPISYIYNIETGAMSDCLEDDNVVIKLEHGNNLTVYISNRSGYWIYEYNYDTLELVNKVKLTEYPFPDLQKSSYLYYYPGDENDYLKETIKEKLNDRSYRYRGTNFYLDIQYGPNIDLTGRYFDYWVSGGEKDIFVVLMREVEAYSH